MFSELEQVECLIQTGAAPPEQYAALDQLAQRLQAGMAPPRPALEGVAPEELPRGDLRYVLERYLQNARALAGT